MLSEEVGGGGGSGGAHTVLHASITVKDQNRSILRISSSFVFTTPFFYSQLPYTRTFKFSQWINLLVTCEIWCMLHIHVLIHSSQPIIPTRISTYTVYSTWTWYVCI